jgi:phosphoglycolate phosphatase-like HAD superfamily hydrolase
MPLQCLVFDCDGVILDSVPVKTRAFARLAEPFGPEARDRFVMYHTVHGGVSRYKKFEWFFREVLGREISQEESTQWGRRFAEYALDKAQLLAEIVRSAGVEAENALMVGDAVTDRDAAEQVGTLFYGVGQELKGGPFPWGEDLTGLNDWIRARV